ncbi:MAG TPA: sigma-70 family RNA polymerase sigma factor [Polyangiaceae bacterium]
MSPERLELDVPAATAAPPAPAGVPRLEALIREHHAFTWRVLRRLGLAPADADDAAQRVFLTASERLGDIAFGSERAFLFRVASHVASKVHRTRKRRPESLGLDGAEEVDVNPGPDALLDQRRARELLDALLGELSEELRAVFVLFDVEGLTKAEVAEALGIPEGTVASRLRRARDEIAAGVQRRQARARFRGVRP